MTSTAQQPRVKPNFHIMVELADEYKVDVLRKNDKRYAIE